MSAGKTHERQENGNSGQPALLELQYLKVRLALAVASNGVAGEAIPVFHRWIREQGAGETLIDVADYRHVPGGPGVLLVGHEGDYGFASGGERAGLTYRRKTALPGKNPERLAQAVRALLSAAIKLESAPELDGKLTFDRREIEVAVNDRMLAPNRAETFQALQGDFAAFATGLLGETGEAAYRPRDPRESFAVTLRAARPFALDALLAKLG